MSPVILVDARKPLVHRISFADKLCVKPLVHDRTMRAGDFSRRVGAVVCDYKRLYKLGGARSAPQCWQ